ncbi:MAG: hypothetical protein VX015_08740 [Planctomycetota bacterium]|nr:hypothetical protein [Planctomycetota bacterium]
MQENQSQPTPESTPGLDPLADSATVETLVRYDELDVTARERLEADPRVRATIAHLERADRWLEDLAHVSGPAPDAELLYDFGGGPGALSVDDDDRVRVEDHLADAPIERGWVDALRRQPPPPLVLEPLDEVEDEARAAREESPAPLRALRPTASRTWVAWTPLAAAALILAMVLGGGVRPTVLEGGLPRSPIVRGDRAPGPLFPRGRVLAGGAFAATPDFELVEPERASAARIELRVLESGGTDPFEAGRLLWDRAASEAAPALVAGRYEWTAFATVDGIEVELGRETFRVVAGNPALLDAATGGPKEARADVVLLHAAGFLTDARRRARDLEPGDKRRQYLSGR